MTIIAMLIIFSTATLLVSAILMEDIECMRDVFFISAGALFASLLSMAVIDNLVDQCLQYQEECTELLKSLIKS